MREPPTTADLNTRVSAQYLRAWHDLLAAEPHVAGTEGDQRVIEKIAAAFAEMGLEVQRHEFWALLPRPITSVLEIVTPEPRTLILKEQMLDEDLYSQHPALDPGWNAFSGSGDATGEVVYANYGRKEDFAMLASLGIDVRGKIVLARYGGNYRGYKAIFAEKAGAAGLVIFTDPADSGVTKGAVYPAGGWASDTCIERGSLLALPYSGDALTPGIEATKDAPRLDITKIGLPTIPVQPIGYAAAMEIVKRMTGEPVETFAALGADGGGWRGGLPAPYRLAGGSALRVRLKVEQDRQVRPSANIIGTLKGDQEPDRLIVIGCHHDAWGFGASDPLAGTIALMESARVFSEAAKEGKRPRRTLSFGAWGAEEYGIIGSTEWVEGNKLRLATDAVAYFNLDMASMGADLGSGAAPSIRRVLAAAAGEVPQARDPARMALEPWLARGKDPRDPTMPAFGDLGGGSDHVAIWCHVGVPSAGIGASGAPGTAYHSIYDNLAWYRKVVGEDYEPAMMVTRMVTAATNRLAEATLLPIEPHETIAEFRRHLRDISARGAAQELWKITALAGDAAANQAAATPATPSVPATPATSTAPPPALAEPLQPLDALAAEVEKVVRAEIESWRARASEGSLTDAQRTDLNSRLIASDRMWILNEGLPGRPWYRNTFAAPDRDSGYAPWMLPLLRGAVEDKDAPGITAAIAAYESILRSLRELVEVPE